MRVLAARGADGANGTAGVIPGTGGATDGTGGAEDGTGGAEVGTGGAEVGAGGAEVGAGGAEEGTGTANGSCPALTEAVCRAAFPILGGGRDKGRAGDMGGAGGCKTDGVETFGRSVGSGGTSGAVGGTTPRRLSTERSLGIPPAKMSPNAGCALPGPFPREDDDTLGTGLELTAVAVVEPPSRGLDLSTVTVFLRFMPLRMSPKRASRPPPREEEAKRFGGGGGGGPAMRS